MESPSHLYLPTIVKDRVTNQSLPSIIICTLCGGIIWQPVACSECEFPFCESCIQSYCKLHENSSPQCPKNGCSWSQRSCPKAYSQILKDIQIKCQYRGNGCSDVLAYNELEKHEQDCGFQLKSCSGCEEKVCKKDLEQHESQCTLVSVTCQQCLTSYERRKSSEHTENKCLQIQIEQLRQELKTMKSYYDLKIEQLEQQKQ